MGFGELASTREAQERDDGNESVKRERGVNPFVPAFLNNSNIPQLSRATGDEAATCQTSLVSLCQDIVPTKCLQSSLNQNYRQEKDVY